MQQIGRYQIVAELGRGGMAVVYKARDPRTGREVAIKALLAGRDATAHQRQRFGREARALAKVDHPNVVRVREVGDEQSVPFLVMDYCQGGSLQESLRGTPLSAPRAVQIGSQLAAGLQAAHAEGVLHRDIKPENVLLDAHGFALLVDFGLAKDLDRSGETQRLTHTGVFLGTPGFWAPEQAAGEHHAVGPATDIYGLGATLYAALSGRAPIVASGLIENLTATIEGKPPPLRSLRPDVPRGLEAVVMRCLEKEPSARWASAEELELALACCLSPGSGAASPKEGLRRLALGGAALLVLAVGGATMFGQGRSAEPAPSPASPSPSATEVALPPLGPRTTPSTTSSGAPDAEALFERAQREWDSGRDEEGTALLRRAAKEGHPAAMHLFGWALANGRGLLQDLNAGAKWYRRAAEKGNTEAMFSWGFVQELGLGVAQDEAQAVVWHRRAADRGHAKGMLNLGVMIGKGRGVAKDKTQAGVWFRRSAEKGNREAMYNLAGVLASGWGTDQDDAQAALWYRRAAEKGHVKAMFFLGEVLASGRGVPKDEAEAGDWYSRAAKQGHVKAMLKLGEMLERGLGVPQDKARALKLYRRAAKSTDPQLKQAALDGLQRMGQ